MTRFVLHADDFGASRQINRTIIETIEKGWVRSVSVIATGGAFDEAAEYLRARPDILASLHFNLVEGRPLDKRCGLLINASGAFCSTFQSLLTASVFASAAFRRDLREQMQTEFEMQAHRFMTALPNETASFRLDSHGHTHVIPVVAESLLSAALSRSISYVRVPAEPFFISAHAQDLMQAVGPNAAKHIILNALGARLRKRLEEAKIACNAYMIGVLHTRRMSQTSIVAGVRAAQRRLRSRQGRSFYGGDFVEVLLHPGAAAEDERMNWRGEPEMWKFYTSPDRQFEAETAMAARLKPIFGPEG